MAPSKTVTPLLAEDLEAAIDMTIECKNDLAISMLLVKDYPNPRGRRLTTEPAIKGSLEDPDSTCVKVVDDETGEMIGCFVYKRSRPQEAKVEEKPAVEQSNDKSKLNPALEIFNMDVLNMVMEGVSKISSHTAGLDCIEIIFGTVKKGYRRQGIGSLMMQSAIDRSKQEGVPIVTQAEPAAYEFFKSLGFRDTVSADFDLARFAPPNSGFGLFRLQGIIKE